MSEIIRAKLLLETAGTEKNLKKTAKDFKDLGSSGKKSTDKSADGLSKVEKNAIRAAEALRNLRKEEARKAVPGGRYAKEGADAAKYSKEIKAAAQQQRNTSKAFHKAEMRQKADFFNDNEQKLARTRYALYDVGRRALGFGTAITAGLTATVISAAKFESAFTSVERTTGLAEDAAQVLKKTLIEMSTVIPVSFEEITKIATLGAQLGIAAEAVDDFTETVAKFSAITGISVEQVGLSFGRLAQLIKVPVSEFENLSSAIAYTGVNAVATDAEILKMSESIGASSSMAGLSADEIVGLGSALASLKVRPEQARGVFIRLFRIFDTNAAGATAKMDDLAKVVGLTTDEAIRLYQTDPSKFFTSFLAGSEAAGTLNETMAALGITNVRELDVIQRLAGNQDVLSKALSDSREQYLLGSYSSEAYAKVQDDLSSKLIIMKNAIAALADSFAGPLADGAKFVVDIFTSLVKWLTEMPYAFKVLGAVIAALTAAAALFFGSIALGIAGLLALKLAFKGLGDETVKAGISISTFKALLLSMLPDTGVVSGALTALGLKADSTGRAFTRLGLKGKALSVGILGIAGIAAGVVIGIVQMVQATKGLSDGFQELGAAGLDANGGISEAMEALQLDTDSGVVGLNRFEVALTEIEVQAKKTEAAVLAQAQAMQDKTRAGSQEQVAEAWGKTADEAERAGEASDAYAQGQVAGETDVDPVIVQEQGAEYAKWLAKGARKYIREDGTSGDLAVDLAKLSGPQQAILEGLGFDWFTIFDEAIIDSAGNSKGGEAYVAGFQGQLDRLSSFMSQGLTRGLETSFSEQLASAIDVGYISAEMGPAIQKAFNESGMSAAEFAITLAELPEGFKDAAKTADATNLAVRDLAKAEKLYSDKMAEAREETGMLNDELEEFISNMTAVSERENKVSDALDSFAQSAVDTAGELDGMGTAAKVNLSNFAKFMKEATDASIDAGEGTAGAFTRISAGLLAMDNAGINTSDAFALARDSIIGNIISVAGTYSGLREQLEKQINTAGLESAIRAFYALKMAADGIGLSAAIGIFDQMNLALEALGVGASVNLKVVEGSATKALTALQKLIAAIASASKFRNLFSDVQDSMEGLGESLAKNGKVFSIFTENGRSNISALDSVISSLAAKSGGNVTKFANDLASLRKALIESGAGVGSLKVIDDITKQIGKTGKSSAHSVNQFADALKATGDSVRQLYKVKDAMDKIGSGLKRAFEAIYSQGDSLDSVTLGWLDMADAADAARESIASAGEDISDARIEIAKLDAEIQGLAADKGKLEYQLSIALKYGDTLRANELRAEIAQLNADVLVKEDSISDANDSISKSAEQIALANGVLGSNPNVRQQIERNEALRDMALRYGDVAASLIASAKPGEDLNEIINDQVTAFEQSAIKMGYSNSEASDMADTLRDELIYQMDQIPEDITTDITAETSVATAAVDRFVNFANARMNQIKDKIVTVTTIYQSGGGSAVGVIRRASGGLVSGPGSSTSDSISAQLSNGEYVVRASAVSKYGVDFFNSLNQMQTAPAGMSSAISQQSGGNGMVYLSPEDRQLLRAAIDRPISLYTDNTVIASSANKGNQILAQRGIK